MATAPRDANFVPAALAWDSSGAATVTWKMDVASERAIIEIADATPPTPTPDSPPAKRDANFVPVALALVDGTTDTLVPLTCDSNGYLVCVVNWE